MCGKRITMPAAALSTLSSAIAASHAEAFAALRSVDRRREGVLPLPLAAEALSRLPLLSLSRAQVLAALAEASTSGSASSRRRCSRRR